MAPTRIVPDTPRDLETICMKCLQKETDKRYPSALALAEDLERFQLGEPILARPVGSVERLWRWCRRNPRIALLTGAVGLLLISVTAVSATAAVRISKEQQETLRQKEEADRQKQEAVAQRDRADENAIAAREAEKKATAQREVASQQRKLTLDTLYSLVTKVEDKLRGKEDMNDLRKDILKTAMDGLNSVSRSAEGAAFADRSMGVAMQRMGDVYEQMGQTEEALRQYKLSLTLFDRLAPQEPQNDWIPWNRAVSFDKLGGLSHEFLGDAAGARDYYQNSLNLRQALAARIETPAITPALRSAALSISYIKLADLSNDLGDPAQARDYARRAMAENETLLATNPANGQAARFLGVACLLLGKVNNHLGEVTASRDYLRRCLEGRAKAVRADPTSADAKRELGIAYEALGDLEFDQRDATAAQEAYRKAHALYEALCKKERDNAEDQWHLGHTHYKLGTVHLLLGDQTTARNDYAESLKLREVLAKADPRSAQKQAELMLALARCGKHAEASQAAADIGKRVAKHPGWLFSVACGYALCVPAVAEGKQSLSPEDKALQRRYADLAVGSLEQACAVGYRDRQALRLHPDLAPLRGSRPFEALLAKVSKS
jgi:serine/threonine-protein kinase